ncbi:MAG: hypothetical protein KBI01_09790 [Oscillospiraceae bacterium]|nr:hypothetical protein [Oscillospiraceae bacterium]
MNEQMYGCELDVPYPPVQVSGKNLYYASLLTNDYAGVVSEMSAVMGYVFQSLVSNNQIISATINCISIVEMRHLRYIGELIELLGGKPRFAVQSGCKSSFWEGQFISYEANPKYYLKENIANEKTAIANYSLRIKQINDNFVQSILNRIIMDEENHIRIFNALLDAFY